MKKIIKLTESDLAHIVKRVINEMDDKNNITSINDLDQFLLKSDNLSNFKDEIKKSFKKWSSSIDPNLKDYANVVSIMTTRDVLPRLRFKDNKSKKLMVRDFLIDYIENKYF
jgi:hypothetical protein